VRRAEIAVCGAGPVGLFVAILLQLRYGSLSTTYAKEGETVRFSRAPDCPNVTIFERRPRDSWGTRTQVFGCCHNDGVGEHNADNRTIVICVDWRRRFDADYWRISQTISVLSSVQALLSRLLPAPNNFSPTCAINVMEKRFRDFVENVLRVEIIEKEIPSNAYLLENYDFDAIIWAGGKHAPPGGIRERLHMPITHGQGENALIFNFNCDREAGEGEETHRSSSGRAEGSSGMARV
jgi:hypothetical protein